MHTIRYQNEWPKEYIYFPNENDYMLVYPGTFLNLLDIKLKPNFEIRLNSSLFGLANSKFHLY